MTHLGIDATNLRQGGGTTHLVELLHCFDPERSSIQAITIWCSTALASRLPRSNWLTIRSDRWIDSNFIFRFLGQQLLLSRSMQESGCDVGFFPGGNIPLVMKLPAVTMSQNMLPFNLGQARLFGVFNPVFWKLVLLRLIQSSSFKRADGLIFLSEYAQQSINKNLKLRNPQALIPHGISSRFVQEPREQKSIKQFSAQDPFKLIYVSILMPYKHQIEVANAISRLRQGGVPVSCEFIGPSWGWYGALTQNEIASLDPAGCFLAYAGEIEFKKLELAYHGADGFIFASSCENLPNILIEAMSAGLPIACSRFSPMMDVLGEAGFYFAPEDPQSIYACLVDMLKEPQKRYLAAISAYERAAQYSWQKCSIETFQFIDKIARSFHS